MHPLTYDLCVAFLETQLVVVLMLGKLAEVITFDINVGSPGNFVSGKIRTP